MPAEDFEIEEFDRIQSTNARGAWCAAKHFGSLMLRGGRGGCIINVDSFVTASVLKHVVPYSMSKAAVQALTKGLAVEWGPRGIRVNGLAPGLILTPISEALWKQPHMEKWAREQTPLGRMGSQEDLLGAALFLASPGARFITGQTLRVDGGLSAGRHWPIDGPPSLTGKLGVSGLGGSSRGFASSPVGSMPATSAVFNYCAGALVANPFEGNGVEVNKKADAIQGAEHTVYNGREEPDLVEGFGGSLGPRGFSLQQHVSSVRNFYDDAEVKETYYAELVAEARRLTGADHFVVASHVVRNEGPSAGEPRGGVRSGAFMVHGDFSDEFRRQLLEMLAEGRPNLVGKGGLGLSQEELREGRLVVLNFWRPLCREPLRRAPMAVLDATSVRAGDLEIYAHDPHPPPQNYSLPLPNLLTVARNSPGHRWYYFPGMVRDEYLAFKTYDSLGSQPANGVGVHSAFADPRTELDAPLRESVEARVICFFSPVSGAGGASTEVCNEASVDSDAKWQRGTKEVNGAKPPMENVERIQFYKWLEKTDGWNGAVGLTAKFTVSEEQAPVFIDIMRENIAATRREAGMLQYDLVPDYEPGAAGSGTVVYWLLERFRSRHDLLLHVESDHYKRCQERFLRDMGGHPLVQIGFYRIDPVEPELGA
jgi:quinol monooxygenase YgiN